MKKWLFVASILLIISSCTESNAPENLIDKGTMKEVLLNMHLADASLDYVSPQDSMLIKAKSKYNFIFQKYEVDSAAFSSSLKYYSDKKPGELKKIYDGVLKELEELKQSQQPLYARSKRLIPMTYKKKDYKVERDTVEYPLKRSIERTDSLRQQREIELGIDF